jgi:hypothetical protein
VSSEPRVIATACAWNEVPRNMLDAACWLIILLTQFHCSAFVYLEMMRCFFPPSPAPLSEGPWHVSEQIRLPPKVGSWVLLEIRSDLCLGYMRLPSSELIHRKWSASGRHIYINQSVVGNVKVQIFGIPWVMTGARGSLVGWSESWVFASCCVCEIKVRGFCRLHNVNIVGFYYLFNCYMFRSYNNLQVEIY